MRKLREVLESPFDEARLLSSVAYLGRAADCKRETCLFVVNLHLGSGLTFEKVGYWLYSESDDDIVTASQSIIAVFAEGGSPWKWISQGSLSVAL